MIPANWKNAFGSVAVAGLIFSAPFQVFYETQNERITEGYEALYFNRFADAVTRFSRKDGLADLVGLATAYQERGKFAEVVFADTVEVGCRYFEDVVFPADLEKIEASRSVPAAAFLYRAEFLALCGKADQAAQQLQTFVERLAASPDARPLLPAARSWQWALASSQAGRSTPLPAEASQTEARLAQWAIAQRLSPTSAPPAIGTSADPKLSAERNQRNLVFALAAEQKPAEALKQLAALDMRAPELEMKVGRFGLVRLYDPLIPLAAARAYLAMSASFFSEALAASSAGDAEAALLADDLRASAGYALLLTGDAKAARRVLEAGRSEIAAVYRGLAQVADGQAALARSQLTVVAQSASPAVVLHLGRAYWQLGDRQQALAATEKSWRMLAAVESTQPELYEKYTQRNAHQLVRMTLAMNDPQAARKAHQRGKKSQQLDSPEHNLPEFLLDQALLASRSGAREFPTAMGIYSSLESLFSECHPLADMFQGIYAAAASQGGEMPKL
ncbi:MAG: hypothetical protein HYV63_27255 [Candidatus Schekmanbacteria bacterium]|nr:hypothetical protein [Candidatus Schekmanbacteria bacterium]